MGSYIRNGINYSGGGDNSKMLSYEEYQALSEAEKKNGTTYYITDVESSDATTNILDTKEKIESNTEENKIAGALGVKEGFEAIDSDLDNARKNVFHNRISISNIDAVPTEFSAYATTADTEGTFPTGFGKVGVMIPIRRTSSIFIQIYIDISNNMAIRSMTGSGWNEWSIK